MFKCLRLSYGAQFSVQSLETQHQQYKIAQHPAGGKQCGAAFSFFFHGYHYVCNCACYPAVAFARSLACAYGSLVGWLGEYI